MELDGVRGMLEGAGWKDVDVCTVECKHPDKTAEEATEEFYGMGNPSVKLLMKGLSEDEIAQTKRAFTSFYEEIWPKGKRQFELAIIAVGTRS